jgi:hypothetical protein
LVLRSEWSAVVLALMLSQHHLLLGLIDLAAGVFVAVVKQLLLSCLGQSTGCCWGTGLWMNNELLPCTCVLCCSQVVRGPRVVG